MSPRPSPRAPAERAGDDRVLVWPPPVDDQLGVFEVLPDDPFREDRLVVVGRANIQEASDHHAPLELREASVDAFTPRYGEFEPIPEPACQPDPPPAARRLWVPLVVAVPAVAVATMWLAYNPEPAADVNRVHVIAPAPVPPSVPEESRPPDVTIVATYQDRSARPPEPVDRPAAASLEPATRAAAPVPPPVPASARAPLASSAVGAGAASTPTPPPAVEADAAMPRPPPPREPDVPAAPAAPLSAGPVLAATLADPVAVPPPAIAPAAAIRGLLARYEDAYDRRDAQKAAQLWPSLDVRALTRAFEGLDRQDLTFERCEIDASGERGSAVCVGTMRYVPTVGRGVEKQDRVTWTFDLTRTGGDWRIVKLTAR